MNSNVNKTMFSLCIMMILVVATYFYINMLLLKPCPLNNYQSTAVQIKEHEITVDIASTEAQRSCGLSNRSNLPDNYGMLFVFEKNQILDFWMKDTYIPLTVAYIDEDRRIMELHQFTANQTDINAASKKVGQYVLESSPEWFIQNNIQVGDYVKFSLP